MATDETAERGEPEIEYITKEEAIAAVRAQAFEVTNKDSSDYGRRLVRCMMGPFGTDWDEAKVIEELEKASKIAWLPYRLKHDLAVQSLDGQIMRFDVTKGGGK